MRPVNLLPPELRQGAHTPMRTGPIPYILVGALVAVLAGVALLVLTGNQISERETEVAQLKREDGAAVQEAKRLAAYTQFQVMHEQRVETVTSLADSRFDWERVMRELSLVLPHDVWLTELGASASPEAAAGAGGGELREMIPGPALQIEGCSTGQEATARFVTALKEIDGVTRVAVESSGLSDDEEGAGDSSGGSGSADTDTECRTRNFIALFEIVVAFDAAPTPITAEAEEEAPATATETAETSSSETETAEGE
jgi:Tfp pilus assembly protein PilN